MATRKREIKSKAALFVLCRNVIVKSYIVRDENWKRFKIFDLDEFCKKIGADPKKNGGYNLEERSLQGLFVDGAA